MRGLLSLQEENVRARRADSRNGFFIETQVYHEENFLCKELEIPVDGGEGVDKGEGIAAGEGEVGADFEAEVGGGVVFESGGEAELVGRGYAEEAVMGA